MVKKLDRDALLLEAGLLEKQVGGSIDIPYSLQSELTPSEARAYKGLVADLVKDMYLERAGLMDTRADIMHSEQELQKVLIKTHHAKGKETTRLEVEKIKGAIAEALDETLGHSPTR